MLSARTRAYATPHVAVGVDLVVRDDRVEWKIEIFRGCLGVKILKLPGFEKSLFLAKSAILGQNLGKFGDN